MNSANTPGGRDRGDVRGLAGPDPDTVRGQGAPDLDAVLGPVAPDLDAVRGQGAPDLDAVLGPVAPDPDAGLGSVAPDSDAVRGQVVLDPDAVLGPVSPHGGRLVNRWLRGLARDEARLRAGRLPRVRLDAREAADLEMIGDGALSPLTGFMGSADYRSVVAEMRLAGGLLWALPVTLAVDRSLAESLAEGDEIALEGPDGRILALMRVEDRFAYDREQEAVRCYGTADPDHPGVRRLLHQGEVYLGGEVWLLDRPRPQFPEYHLTPAETRAVFAERGWRTVVGFQTRNPVHRAHEYIQKCALEICDGLLLHPLVGETKSDDVPAAVRMKAYETILAHYFPADRVVLAVFPAAMRYAGPREAVWHAICRKNYGCTHFIVGRDHAGVGSYYGTYDAQRIFDSIDPAELGITVLCFEHTFFCRACGAMASPRTCPHGPGERVTLSGTRVREMLYRGEAPPPEFTRPEVARVLMDGLRAPTL